MKIRMASALTNPTITTAGDEPHQLRHAEHGQHDLDEPAEQHGGDEVVHPVLAGDGRDDERDRAGRGGDHRGPPAEERDRDGHDEGGEQADPRVDAGDDRERDRFGDQRDRDDEPGEDFAGEDAGAAEGLHHGGFDAVAGRLVGGGHSGLSMRPGVDARTVAPGPVRRRPEDEVARKRPGQLYRNVRVATSEERDDHAHAHRRARRAYRTLAPDAPSLRRDRAAHPSGRTDGGFRLYTDDDEPRLLLIRRMKPLGYTLEEMGDLLSVVDTLGDLAPGSRERFDEERREARQRRSRLEEQLAAADEFLARLEARVTSPRFRNTCLFVGSEWANRRLSLGLPCPAAPADQRSLSNLPHSPRFLREVGEWQARQDGAKI